MSRSRKKSRALRALGLGVGLAAVGLVAGEAAAVPAFALTAANALRAFDTATPGTLGAPLAVSGLGNGEDLLGIDYRPANGGLYGLGNLGQLYQINPTTGAATAIGAPLDPASVPLNGSSYGFDFNPVVDRIRVTSDLGENFRLNPNNGAFVANDGPLAYAAGDANAGRPATVTASAYLNNDNNPSTGTTLYDIDVNLGVLVTQSTANPPADGQLTTVGSLGLTGQPLIAGFDIAGVSNAAFALSSFDPPFGSQPALSATLFSINLQTGVATAVGTLGDGSAVIRGLALVVIPEPTTALAAAAAGLAAVRRGRRHG